MKLKFIMLLTASSVAIGCSTDPIPDTEEPTEPTPTESVVFELQSSETTLFNSFTKDGVVSEVSNNEISDIFGERVSMFIPEKITMTSDSIFLFKSERILQGYKYSKEMNGIRIHDDSNEIPFNVGRMEGDTFELESTFYLKIKVDHDRNYTSIGQRYGLFENSEIRDYSASAEFKLLNMKSIYNIL